MTIYNVHIYREMRLVYAGIEADSDEAAASIARDKPTGDADEIDDCEGESFSALVDVQGDDDYGQSRIIDFDPQRQRNAAAKLLEALRWITCCPMIRGPVGTTAYIVSDERMALARAAVAEADDAGIISVPSSLALLAALQAVLPFAEGEGESLYECWKRDDDLQIKDASDRCARAIENAHAIISKARAAGVLPGNDGISIGRPRKTARKLLDALKVAEGFVHWALAHGADQRATPAALQFIRSTIAESETAGIASLSEAGHE